MQKIEWKSNYAVLVLFEDEMCTPTGVCEYAHTDLSPISTFFESCICLSFGDQSFSLPLSNKSKQILQARWVSLLGDSM